MSRHAEPTAPGAVARPVRRGYVLLPALTFLVGLVLGAALMWASDDGASSASDGTSQERPAPAAPGAGQGSAPPDPSDSEAASACLEAAGMADEVLDLGREIAGALAELNAARMRTLLDRLEQLEPRVRQSIETCRGLADTQA